MSRQRHARKQSLEKTLLSALLSVRQSSSAIGWSSDTTTTQSGAPARNAGQWTRRALPGGIRAAGSLGVWVGHFLVNRGIADFSWSLTFSGSSAFNTGTNAADSRTFHTPAPGAFALLGLAGMASRRRRES